MVDIRVEDENENENMAHGVLDGYAQQESLALTRLTGTSGLGRNIECGISDVHTLHTLHTVHTTASIMEGDSSRVYS